MILLEYTPGTIPVCKNWIPFATPIAAPMRWVQFRDFPVWPSVEKIRDRMTVRIKDDRNDTAVSKFPLHDSENNGLREDINGISSSKTNFELHVRYLYGSLEVGEK